MVSLKLNRKGLLAASITLCWILAGQDYSAALPNVSVTLTASPAAFPDGRADLTLVVTNTGPDPISPVIGFFGQNFYDIRAPAGWTLQPYGFCELFECNSAVTGLQGPTLQAGESVRLLAASTVRRPPGATITWAAFVRIAYGVYAVANATTTVRGSGPPPTGATALFALDNTRTAASQYYFTGSLSFDTINSRFLETTSELFTALTGHLAVGLLTASGQPTTGMLQLEPPTSAYPTSVASAYSPDVRLGVETGGYLLTWIPFSTSNAPMYSYAISSSGIVQSARGTILAAGRPQFGSIAYAPSARIFMAAFSDCSYGSPLPCHSFVRPVGLDGQPVGLATDLGQGDRPRIVWNPTSNEFALVHVTSAFGSETIEVARVAIDGRLLGRSTVEKYAAQATAEIDVNTWSGHDVVVWTDSGEVFGAELSPTGRVISRGLIAAGMGLSGSNARPFSYNPVSNTFLLIARSSGLRPNEVVELNQHGTPLSARTPLVNPFQHEVVATRTDAAEWRALGTDETFGNTFYQTTRGIATSTRNGGSTRRLGGCDTPDPFQSLGGGTCFDFGWLAPGMNLPGTDPFTPTNTPPPTVPPSGCTMPDPFTSLGGGTCVNGGWLPPGYPSTTGGGSPPPPSTTCTIPDPFVSIGGGVCINGGWIPRGGGFGPRP